MKKIITIMTGALLATGIMAQTVEVMPQYGLVYGAGVEVDLNNNGHLDMLFGGLGRTKHYVEDPDGNEVETERYTWVLMYNPATKKFEEKPTNILAGDRPNFKIADFNGDGIADVVITDHKRLDGDKPDPLYNPGIYEGKGDGAFEKKEMTFSDPEYKFRPIAVAVADFNNDGLIDIVAIGNEVVDGISVNYNAVLINKGNYHFEVTATDLLSQYDLALAFVKVADFNNDGYMDFMVSGNCDNCVTDGHLSYTEIFENIGAESPGDFYALNIADAGIKTKAIGGIDIADFNGDGWLDFAIHGEGVKTGEPADNSFRCVSHVYLNQRNGLYQDKLQSGFRPDLRPLSSTGAGTRAIDWNGDGKYDLFIPGWDDQAGRQTGYFWLNDGTASFGSATNIPGTSEGMIMFIDWNGDGKLDYFMSGFSTDDVFFKTDNEKGRTAAVVLNTSSVVNERPTAPTGLTSTIGKNKVTLKWNAATDKETAANSLSYEYYLKRNGKLYNSCLSHIEGQLDGVRKVLDHGNAMLNKSITLHNLPDGTYEWGVQAIDASYAGSTFASASFIIGTGEGIADESIENNFTLNAANGTLKFSSDYPTTLNVYTVAGILVQTQTNTEAYSTTLPQGIYLVKVAINGESTVRRLIVK